MNIKQQGSVTLLPQSGKAIALERSRLLGQSGAMTETPTSPTAFKIFTADQWAQFQVDGVFLGAPVDLADGYIHLSAADQLQGTLDKHFAGQTGLVIAEVDLGALSGAVKWEVSRGGELFPHLYGPLPMTAVLGEVSFTH